MFSDGNLVGDGSWELRILVTDLNEEPRTLRVKGDLHIGGLMLQLVEDLDATDENRKTTKILLWTPYFNLTGYEALSRIGINRDSYPDCFKSCEISNDREMLEDADAVVFHAWHTDLKLSDLPKKKRKNQIWVLLLQKPPSSTLVDLDSFSGLFNWTMTYRQSSEVYHPHGTFVKIQTPHIANSRFQTKIEPLSIIKASGKPKLATSVISECISNSKREKLILEMKKLWVPIDIYGKCGFPSCGNLISAEKCTEDALWKKLGQTYKFYLAFESDLCIDYVSENFFRAIKYGMVPVVFGGAKYSTIAPEGSFIDARGFDSLRNFSHFLRRFHGTTLRHRTAYQNYFYWKESYDLFEGDGFCTLCEKVKNHSKSLEDVVPHVYYDLKNWWFNYPPPLQIPASVPKGSVKVNQRVSFSVCNSVHPRIILS